MKWLAMLIMVAAMLAVSAVSFGQQAAGNLTTLKDGETCTSDAGCKCVNVDVKKNCWCKITLGSGTQHCQVGDGGGPKPLESLLWALGGAVIGSALTYAVMRRRESKAS